MPQEDQKFLPNVWNDDEKMESLFSDFRIRSVNPQGWDDKYNFWKTLIYKWSRETKTVTFGKETLKRTFQRNGERPLCLDTVLDTMKREEDLMPLGEFLQSRAEQSWLWWGYDLLLRRPAVWGWGLLKSSWSQSDDPKAIPGLLVNTQLLSEMGEEVMAWHHRQAHDNWTEDLVEMSTVWQHCQPICPRHDDFLLVLYHLQHQGCLRLYDHAGTKIIKFTSEHSRLSRQLTPIDQSVIELKRASQCLEQEIAQLDEKIERCKQEALAHFKSGMKAKALQLMKRKRQAEKILKKKEDTLDNLQQLEITLKHTHSEKLILEALQSGSSTLKTILSKDLNPEKCDTMMAEVEETMEQHQEVNQMLSTPVVGFSADSGLSDADLQAELDSILADDDEAKMERLPEPPSSLPSPTPSKNLRKLVAVTPGW